MKYQVQHTLGSVIHEGTRHECELILKAFNTYGVGEHKLELVKLPGKLSDATRSKIVDKLTYMLKDSWDGDCTYEAILYGYTGLDDLSDEELVEQLEYIADVDDEDSEITQLYKMALSEIGVDNMLKGDS